MMRRKFFTCISLFGISFTLMVLTVFLSFLDTTVGAVPPEVNKDRTLYLDRIWLSKDGKNEWRTDASPWFINTHLKSLKTPEKVSFFTRGSSFSRIVNNKIQVFMLKFTDYEFWQILHFRFLEGRPYGQQEVDNGSRVVVISEATRKQYFGEKSALGKSIRIRDNDFKVIGVVSNPPFISFVNSDVWIPYTLDSPKELRKKELSGGYLAMLLAADESRFGPIRQEINQKVAKFPFPNPKEVNTIRIYPQSRFEEFAYGLNHDSSLAQSLFVVFLIMSLIMLLPVINLININISRILERAPEIGIRKAFGATSLTLIGQFVVENVVLTLIGGLIGFGLAIIAADLFVEMVNALTPLQQMPPGQFKLNWRIFSFSLGTCLFFGLASGLYPAWKMSRLHVVNALKGDAI